MLPSFAVYPLWMSWLLFWSLASALSFKSHRKLNGPEEFLYRLSVTVAGFLLIGFSPWPSYDFQHQLWERALNSSLAWPLVYAAASALIFAASAMIRRAILLRRAPASASLQHASQAYIGITVAAFLTATLSGRPSAFCGAGLLGLAFAAKIAVEMMRREPRLPLVHRPHFSVTPITSPTAAIREAVLEGALNENQTLAVSENRLAS